MVLSRAAALPRGISRTIARRAGSSTRSRSWRQTGRRGYASDHGHSQQKSSEIPWIIGSVALTVPAAAWLLSQGPKKGGHGHDEHHEEHAEEGEKEGEEEPKEEEEPQEEKSEDGEEGKEEEPKEESSEEPKEEQKSDEGKSDGKGEEEEYEPPGPNAPKQINWTSSSNKGPGEGQKGPREPSEKKGEKDAAGDRSGAKHPYIDDPEKSKKGVGVTETAKIHGTVDPKAGARGVSQSGSSTDN